MDFVEEFKIIIEAVSTVLGNKTSPSSYKIIDRGVPHEPGNLLYGMNAVYAFYCPSENCFLKIGEVGMNTKMRFNYQHYKAGSANSTLAGSLLNDPEMVSKYRLNDENIGTWIKQITRRIDIFFDSKTNPFSHEMVEKSISF